MKTYEYTFDLNSQFIESIEAFDIEHAAEEAAANLFYTHEPFQYADVWVREDENDEWTKFMVEVEADPVFHAYRKYVPDSA